ncbi:hypothetical protein CYMTET_44091 [Cymbomonas tetramitiformis]|uniref:RRM domain-containing protein n=1 Tax=Cymbomonas tetramitiformis TaxID=36881 RepID=A0AAE0EZD3_9CHLO|nr:hypothetical protein CYMTET_44091 [Cymbomonas tetramitiformis]
MGDEFLAQELAKFEQEANPIQHYLDSNMPVPAGPQTREPPPMADMKGEPQHGVLSEAIAGVKRALAAAASGQSNPFGNPEGERTEKKKHFRTAAGERWVDDTLAEWPENDHRIFVGDLGNEVNDDVLAKAFVKFASFAKAKCHSDKRLVLRAGAAFYSYHLVPSGSHLQRMLCRVPPG